MDSLEARSEWYNRVAREISPYMDTLSKKDAKKYKLDLLLRIARRVDSFSSACDECQALKPEISRLTEDLGNLIQIPDKEKRKAYLKTINNMTKHLQKEHKLVTEGQTKGIWIGIGMAIGSAIGGALDNPGVGVALGIAIGIAIGNYMDKKAKAEGKVI